MNIILNEPNKKRFYFIYYIFSLLLIDLNDGILKSACYEYTQLYTNMTYNMIQRKIYEI